MGYIESVANKHVRIVRFLYVCKSEDHMLVFFYD